jgi:hypothetical protein
MTRRQVCLTGSLLKNVDLAKELRGNDSTSADLDAILAEWRDRLGLRNWDIKIKWARQADLTSESCEGDVNYSRDSMKATIRILSEQDWYNLPFGLDPERTVCHELLHLLWGAVGPENGTETHVQFEQAINITAAALVALKRGEK